MSTTEETTELETALREKELTPEEIVRVRELIAGGGQIDAAIAFVVKEREEPEPEEEEAQPPDELGEEPSAKQLKALDAECVRHAKRVHEVMGEFVSGFVACEACDGHGLTPPGPPPPRPQTHEWFKACETCQGFGEVLTGSIRDGQTSRDCPTCKGRGYLEALDGSGAALASQESAVAAGIPAPPPPAEPPPASANGAAQTFGVPAWMGNPELGR